MRFMSHRRNFLLTLGIGPAACAFPQSTSSPQAPSSPAKDSDADIFQAAAKGDIARATELAKQNPAIARLRSADGWTPLHYATRGGQTAMIFFLTAQGADLSAGPESPLLAAAGYPDSAKAIEMSHALLMNGSDPNAKGGDSRSALDVAQARGYADVVELLVHRGASGAADASKTERVYFGRRYRFDAEGRPWKPEDIDGLPQDFINDFVRISHANADRVKHLLKVVPGLASAHATWDEMGIEAAAHMGLTALVEWFASHGAPVSTCSAALLGLGDRVKALVGEDAGCVRERGAHDIGLLLYTAYGEQQPEVADFLLRSGVSAAAIDFGGLTALHTAARKGYVELADVLLTHGADVNVAAKSRGAETPLAIAIKAKQDQMANFLKSRGARV